MQGGVGVQFRPTIVLCLGAEGRAVGEWLVSLLPSLDAPLRAGVALLAASEPVGVTEPDAPLMSAWLAEDAEAADA